MSDILHRVGAVAPIDRVYEALATPTGVASWWSASTTGGTMTGQTMTVAFDRPDTGERIGAFDLTLEELVPHKRVAWRVIGGPPEWMGTLIGFDLKTEGDYTIVDFAHQGWAEPGEFMAHCSTKWAMYLMSFKAFVESGAGAPAPADVQISNWH